MLSKNKNLIVDKMCEGSVFESFTDPRYEIKIPLQKGQLNEFNTYIRNNSKVRLKKVYSNRKVNSIYLDDDDLSSYADNVAGISRRIKRRFRWYDNDLNSIVFENKIKKNKASIKQSERIINKGSRPPVNRKDVRGLLHKSISSKFFPNLEVNYQREYYELGFGIRMTIDTEMKFRKLHPIVQSKFTSSPVYAVVEFKYSVAQSAQAKSLLSGIPFRVFRHSKYVIGMDTVCR
jgi:hypothetical protein